MLLACGFMHGLICRHRDMLTAMFAWLNRVFFPYIERKIEFAIRAGEFDDFCNAFLWCEEVAHKPEDVRRRHHNGHERFGLHSCCVANGNHDERDCQQDRRTDGREATSEALGLQPMVPMGKCGNGRDKSKDHSFYSSVRLNRY